VTATDPANTYARHPEPAGDGQRGDRDPDRDRGFVAVDKSPADRAAGAGGDPDSRLDHLAGVPARDGDGQRAGRDDRRQQER